MKDYALHIKIKNNYLLTMMRQHGLTTAAELSRLCGVSQAAIGAMLNLQTPAYAPRSGGVALNVGRVCDFFHCTPDDIFPEQHLQESLKVNKAFLEANAEDLIPVHMRLECQDPLDLLLEEEREERGNPVLVTAISRLNPQQQEVLKLRYGLEDADGQSMSLDATAERLGVNRKRVRQIESKALRILRGPFGELQKTGARDR